MRNSNKNTIYVEANNTNIYARLQIHHPYGFWEEDFFFQQFEQNSYGW